ALRRAEAALARLPAGPDTFDVQEARARFAAALSMAA
ncbi:MAG: beta-hexosaminidase, partial [Methylobacterium sp.]